MADKKTEGDNMNEREVLEVALVQTRSLDDLKESREKMLAYIKTQLEFGVDYGHIPGVKKSCLLKPGAEKLAGFFNLGARIIDKKEILDMEKGFAYFSYTIEIYHIPSGKAVAQMEGSANSKESKNKNRHIGDLINTMQKMAQKRAYVGGIVQATKVSDLFTHDMEDQHVPHSEREVTNRPPPPEPDREYAPIEGVDEIVFPYQVPFGKYKGKGLNEIPRVELQGYCEYIIKRGKKEGIDRAGMSETVQEFLSRSEEHLNGKDSV